MSTYIPNLAVDNLYLSPTAYLSADANQNIHVFSNGVGTNISSTSSGNVSFLLTMNTGVTTPTSFPTNTIYTYGSYFFVIQGANGNACAQINIAKSSSTDVGCSMFKLVSCEGSTGEVIDMTWPASDVPHIYHSTTSLTPSSVTYTISVMGPTMDDGPNYQTM